MSNKTLLQNLLFIASICLIVNHQANGAVIKFDQSSDAGLLSYSQGPNSLRGKRISFDRIEAEKPAANSNRSLLCFDCTLDFETGSYMSYQPINEFAGFAMFNAGGFFRLSGRAIDTFDNSDIANGELLAGVFERPLILSVANGLLNFSGFGKGNAAQELLGFYGLNNDLQLSFSLQSQLNANLGNELPSFVSAISEADVIGQSNAAATEVSEPRSLFLMLMGLLGVIIINRQFFR